MLVQETGGFENYLSKMAQSGTWGDGITLAGAVAVYGRPIQIVCSDGSLFTIDTPATSPKQQATVPLTLGYFGTKESYLPYHYVSLKSVDLSNACDSRRTAATTSSTVVTGVDAEQPTDLTEMSDRPSNINCHANINHTSTKRHRRDETRSANGKVKKNVKVGGQKKKKHDVVSKRQRDFAWLEPTDCGALCKTCVSFYTSRELPRDHSGIFVNKPFNNWKKSTGATEKNNKLLKHANSDSHRTAVAFEKNGLIMETTARTVYSMVHAQSAEEQQLNLNRVADFIDTAYYLFKHEIAHTTNYSSLLALIARLDSGRNIQSFMDTSPLNATYASNNTAIEFLHAISDWLTASLLSRVRASPAIAILADESTDVRTRNELSVCIRFVENGMAIEAFIGLTQLKSTAAEDVKVAILNMLKEHEVPLGKIHWMAFDGASNMSGNKNGVQAKLKAEGVLNGNYVHCRSHLLNLAAANVANAFKPLQALLSALNSTWRFFHKSPKRHNRLVEMQKILGDPQLELVSTGDTRWTSHYRAVKAVKLNLRSLVITLQDVHCSAGDLSSEAGGLLLTFQNKTSIVLLYALEEILNPLYVLTLALQSPKLSLIDLPEKVSFVIL